MNIYVANIPFKSTESDLKELFQQHCEVVSVRIVIDKLTNRSRGFGFVEMSETNAGKNAINELNGVDFEGKKLVVNEARPKNDSPGGGYGNNGTGSGYGNRGGGFNKRW